MRRAARGETYKFEDTGLETTLNAGTGGEAAPATSSDQLEYLLDMLLELRGMAEQAEAQTLAGILDLAYCEARRQMDLHHKL